jgi:hypothetical protein
MLWAVDNLNAAELVRPPERMWLDHQRVGD